MRQHAGKTLLSIKAVLRPRSMFLILALLSVLGSRTIAQEQQIAALNPIGAYLIAAKSGTGNDTSLDEFALWEGSVPSMTHAQLEAGVATIAEELSLPETPSNTMERFYAALLLQFISRLPNGADLLSPHADLLASMLNDSGHKLSGPAALTLYNLGLRRPDLGVPVLEAALAAPEVNAPGSVGVGVADMLLHLAPRDRRAQDCILTYLQRPDLTDLQLKQALVQLRFDGLTADNLVGVLAAFLKRPDQNVKVVALIWLSGFSDSERGSATQRMQQMAASRAESARVRSIATRALQGPLPATAADPE